MTCTDMCFTLPNLKPIGSDPSVTSGVGDEANSLPCAIPQPSPTDLSSLFHLRHTSPSSPEKKPAHIPRPRNAFILFRCDFVQQSVPEEVINDHRDLSRLAGCMWRKMSDLQKQPWFEKAEVEKRFHSEVFPEYRYSPATAERPKRIYRRKKPPVPDDVLLTNPYRHRSESEPRSSAKSKVKSRRKHCSAASLSEATPPLPPPPSEVPSVHPCDDERTRTFQHQGFPQSYTRYQSNISTSPPDFHSSAFDQHSTYSSPGSCCGSFVNIRKRSSISPNIESHDWEFNPPDPIIYDQRRHWPSTAEGGRTNGHELDSMYDSPGNLVNAPSLSSSPQAEYSLYSMWKDLGTFHDQAYQQHPAIDEEATMITPDPHPHPSHTGGYPNPHCEPRPEAPVLHHPYPQRVTMPMTLDPLTCSP